MPSNSKLTREQKADLKTAEAEFLAQGGRVAVDGETTFAIMPVGNVEFVSTAVASPDEVKLRGKVGRYHALDRFANGQCTPFPLGYMADIFGF